MATTVHVPQNVSSRGPSASVVLRDTCCQKLDARCVCCRQRGEAQAKLAVADRDAAVVHVYDTRSGSDDPVASSADVHRSPVVALRYNEPHDTVISTDARGTRPAARAEPKLALRLLCGLPQD